MLYNVLLLAHATESGAIICWTRGFHRCGVGLMNFANLPLWYLRPLAYLVELSYMLAEQRQQGHLRATVSPYGLEHIKLPESSLVLYYLHSVRCIRMQVDGRHCYRVCCWSPYMLEFHTANHQDRRRHVRKESREDFFQAWSAGCSVAFECNTFMASCA